MHANLNTERARCETAEAVRDDPERDEDGCEEGENTMQRGESEFMVFGENEGCETHMIVRRRPAYCDTKPAIAPPLEIIISHLSAMEKCESKFRNVRNSTLINIKVNVKLKSSCGVKKHTQFPMMVATVAS